MPACTQYEGNNPTISAGFFRILGAFTSSERRRASAPAMADIRRSRFRTGNAVLPIRPAQGRFILLFLAYNAIMLLSLDIPQRPRGLSQGRICMLLGLTLAVLMLALLSHADVTRRLPSDTPRATPAI